MPREPADNASHLAFILNAVSHAGEVKIDWNNVAAENGIGYARNAATKFKDTVMKYGYKLEQNKLIRLDATVNGTTTAVNGIPKTPQAIRLGSRDSTKTTKKRKTPDKDTTGDAGDADDAGTTTTTTPAKKKKKQDVLPVPLVFKRGYADKSADDDDDGDHDDNDDDD